MHALGLPLPQWVDAFHAWPIAVRCVVGYSLLLRLTSGRVLGPAQCSVEFPSGSFGPSLLPGFPGFLHYYDLC